MNRTRGTPAHHEIESKIRIVPDTTSRVEIRTKNMTYAAIASPTKSHRPPTIPTPLCVPSSGIHSDTPSKSPSSSKGKTPLSVWMHPPGSSNSPKSNNNAWNHTGSSNSPKSNNNTSNHTGSSNSPKSNNNAWNHIGSSNSPKSNNNAWDHSGSDRSLSNAWADRRRASNSSDTSDHPGLPPPPMPSLARSTRRVSLNDKVTPRLIANATGTDATGTDATGTDATGTDATGTGGGRGRFASDALTHFSVRHIDLVRRVLDCAAIGMRWAIAGLVAGGKFVRIDPPRTWYIATAVDQVYADGDGLGIPRNEMFEVADEGVVIRDPAEIVRVDSEYFTVGIDRLILSFKAIMGRSNVACKSAEKLMTLFKTLEHRGLLADPDLQARVTSADTVEAIKRWVCNVLDPEIVANRARKCPRDPAFVAEAIAEIRRHRENAIALFAHLDALNVSTVDSAEDAARKLALVRDHISSGGRRGCAGVASDFAGIVLGSRIAVDGHRRGSGDSDLSSSKSASMPSSSSSSRSSSRSSSPSRILSPSSSSSSSSSLESSRPSRASVSSDGGGVSFVPTAHRDADVKVLGIGNPATSAPTANYGHATAADLPDAFAADTIDIVSRAFDYYTLAMADLLNDQELDLWSHWRWTRIFPTISVDLISGVDSLRVPVVDAHAEKVSVEDALRDAHGHLSRVAPCFDPLKITSFVAGKPGLFHGTGEAAGRVREVRMSLTHQSNVHVPWARAAVVPVVDDLAAIVDAACAAASRSGGSHYHGAYHYNGAYHHHGAYHRHGAYRHNGAYRHGELDYGSAAASHESAVRGRRAVARFAAFADAVRESYLPFSSRLSRHSGSASNGFASNGSALSGSVAVDALVDTIDAAADLLDAGDTDPEGAMLVRACTTRIRVVPSEARRAWDGIVAQRSDNDAALRSPNTYAPLRR